MGVLDIIFITFFDSSDSIRFKYSSYGHVHEHVYTTPLGAIHADINMFVKCAHNLPDKGNRKQRFLNGLAAVEESHPTLLAAFSIKGYFYARHCEMIDLLKTDKKEYGRADLFDGQHLRWKEMLTHPGRLQRAS